jgi:hypothetical protein
MKVCVDTSVWALALIKGDNRNSPYIKELHELIKEVRVQMLGPIRFALLSTIRKKEQYDLVKQTLAEFPDLALKTADYEMAADFHRVCSSHNLVGALTQFLICAASVRCSMPILTIDKNFDLYSEYIPIKLSQPRP